MRLFVAIDLSEAVLEALAGLQESIRQKAALGKGEATWVRPGAMHLTIKFIGEVEDEAADSICEAVAQGTKRHQKITIGVKKVGTFGRPAKVLWVGAGDGNEALLALQKDIEDELAKIGVPIEERNFSGHLTLCRIKSFRAAKRLGEVAKKYAETEIGQFEADSVRVYKSQLTREGSVYTVLSEIKL